jgi:cobalt-zinc-cadmium efflux system outer membrane protein
MSCRRFLSLLIVAACILTVQVARAEGVTPAAPDLPEILSLDEALRIFRARGLDLLIADAAVRNAEGVVQSAGAIANPVVSASVGNGVSYANTPASHANCLTVGAVCTPWIYNLGLTDSAALMDAISGKRGLRLTAARNALAAAKMSRVDAERNITFQVRFAYAQVAQAALGYKFAKDVAESNVTTLKRFQDRLSAGAINEGDLQRIEAQKLESDQALAQAVQTLRQARVQLAFLLGVRGAVPAFEVDVHVLDFSVPLALRDATEVGLLRIAAAHRPDLAALGYSITSSKAQVDLAKRQRFPDITFGVNYSWGGGGGWSTNGAIGPQVLTFGISAPLPTFYQQQGEIKQAEAAVDTNTLQHAKASAQVVNDVSTSFAAFGAAKELVERMEGPRRPGGGLLASAGGAFESVAAQFDRGLASVTDYLDAYRTYVATKVEYFGDLTSYWTAIYQLEQAVATNLHEGK